MTATLPGILREVPLARARQVIFGMEGDWSPTAATIWDRRRGWLGLDAVARRHATHRPSLEIYLDDGWIGIPCFRRAQGENVFDEELARAIVREVERATRSAGSLPRATGSI